MNQLTRVRLVVDVACMGGYTKLSEVLVGVPEGKRPAGRP
jgi:hypothetical protein